VTYIIGEIGINANGSLDIAKALIAMAKRCGCDAVKFQKRTIDLVYSADDQAAPRESPWGTTNGDQKRGLEFGRREYNKIDKFCHELGIDWFASAWDIPSLEFMAKYNCPYNKVASAMLTHTEFVRAVAADGRDTLISTGMDKTGVLSPVMGVFRDASTPFVLMHCIAKYPCPSTDLNLRRLHRLKELHPRIGYSGHEVGVATSLAAVVMGAKYVERHITLDRAMYGSDQSASLEEPGLRRLVQDIREFEQARGDGADTIAPGVPDVAKKLRYWKEAA